MTHVSFALIGYGGISREIVRILEDDADLPLKCTAILVRASRQQQVQAELGPRIPAVASLADLMATRPSIVAECAGHEALREFGAGVLAAGADLATVSSGAFADAGVEARLRRAAAEARRRVLIAAGAIAGIDGLAAARIGGLEEVVYTGRKPVAAWRDTAAESRVDLARIERAETFYRGYAREAATLFPKNANVTATVALAGLGFDRTMVELIADPASRENVHELRYRGAFGEAHLRIVGRPSVHNPKTSALTALSVLRTLLGSCGGALVL